MRFLITAAADPNPAKARAPIDDALIAKYMQYNEALHRAGVLVASEGINPAGKGACIGIKGGKRVVLDGPFAESKELVGGFYLIAVKSLQEAIEWALRCPLGLGIDDVLTIHPMTEETDLPPEMRRIIAAAAPTWSASWSKGRG
jgi:hypothetical protein